jgi:lactate dehydrogenase-like 2-hydroxyacid dehydrogenase
VEVVLVDLSFISSIWNIPCSKAFSKDAKGAGFSIEKIMRKFRKIAIPEGKSRLAKYIDRIQPYSEKTIKLHDQNPVSVAECIDRSKDADCLLVGGSSKLSKEIISKCKKLEYIGLAATLFTGKSSNIDLEAAAARSIIVKGVSDYGDIGVVEFVLSEIIRHIKNADTNTELSSQNIGIIGAGVTGFKVAQALKYFGARVNYYSRSQKIEMEQIDVKYLPLNELLKKVCIISIHVPRNTTVLTKKELAVFTRGKVIINTSVGLPIEKEAMINWLSNQSNMLIADSDGIGYISEGVGAYKNVREYPRFAGFTEEAQDRLISKVERNIITFLVGG